ncbi:unnamed protein product [Acanthoscelides obtectus]|uniref:DDE Tnp4 domain-containing protein n=1 Tax=Acanthoscelides obtectus TaxID=200917 RepID=A0A9P0LMA2_ACAOB|nr:unnamed protein product [Acanthoscelides obtectus]CAK1624023.1 Protein ALP1-like [Acanthoscelides obtectus]
MYKIKQHKLKVALCMAVQINFINNKRKRSIWVKKWMEDRNKYGHMPLLKELRQDYPSDFKNYLRMDFDTFNILLELISPIISKQNTKMRESISAEERLAATLRYLATGRSYEDLKFSTGISPSSLCYIIPETCKAIYQVLKETYLKLPKTKDDWCQVASDFKNQWQFINCGGALDGKHIRIVPPPHSGAQYYNYKNFYSIVLLALVNANYEFIYIDVGKNGRHSDGGILEYTEFYDKLTKGQLHLPNNDETEKHLNYVFLGDEAFSLHENFLKPYPQRDLSLENRVFNYRLSRARNVVENTFGLLAARFRVLHTAIHITDPQNITYVVLAICALHNFLIRRTTSYAPLRSFDHEDLATHELQMGEWRNSSTELTSLRTSTQKNVTINAKSNREKYKQYFNLEGKVPWQLDMIKKGKA